MFHLYVDINRVCGYLENRKPWSLTRMLVCLRNVRLFFREEKPKPPVQLFLPDPSALPSHALFKRRRRVTWVSDSPQYPVWLAEPLQARPLSYRLSLATSRRSAVGAPQQQQKKEQSGDWGGNGLKKKRKRKINYTVTPDVQSLK